MYKRQLMNILSIVDIYFRLKEGRLPDFHPTVYLFGAKSAPGYARAKAIIRYINPVSYTHLRWPCRNSRKNRSKCSG